MKKNAYASKFIQMCLHLQNDYISFARVFCCCFFFRPFLSGIRLKSKHMWLANQPLNMRISLEYYVCAYALYTLFYLMLNIIICFLSAKYHNK